MDVLRVPCPACARLLINPVTGADGQVRCSNCGERFVANLPEPGCVTGAAEETSTAAPADPAKPASSSAPVFEAEGGAALAAAAPPGRPPQPASYGAVTLLAYLLLFAASFGSLLNLTFAVLAFLHDNRFYWDEAWGGIAFLALMAALPLVAFMLVRSARSLRRMDAAALELAWRLHALPQPPPPPVGSELPYILPCMAGGGLTVMMAVIGATQFDWDPVSVIFALVAGPLLFLLGLTFADLRRFCWRTAWLAKAVEGATRLHEPAPQTHGWILGLAIAAAVLSALAWLILLPNVHPLDFHFFLIFTLVAIGIDATLCLAIHRIAGAAGAWCVAGRSMARRRSVVAVPGPATALNALPVVGAIWGLLVMVLAFHAAGRYWDHSDYAAVLLCLAVSLFAVTAGLLLNRIHLAYRLTSWLVPSPVPLAHRHKAGSFSFLGRLDWTALAAATASWLSALLMMSQSSDAFEAWVILSGPYYFALWLILLAAMVRGMADRWEAAARAYANA